MKSIPILTVACVLAFTTLPARSESSRVDEIKTEIEELKAQVEELKGAGNGAQKALENIEVAKEQVEAARTEIEEIEESLKKSEYLLGIYQRAFRIVAKISPGTSLGASVFLKDGTTLQNVIYVGSAKGGVRVETSAGPRVVPFSLMPETWAQYFGLPPQIPAPTANLAGLMATKPDVAWTEESKKAYEQEQAVAMVDQGEEEEVGAVDQEVGSETADAGDSEPTASEIIGERVERNRKKIQQIYLLRAEYNRLAKQQREQKKAKFSEQEKFRRMKIKKAQSHIDKVLSVFDEEIARLGQEMEGLQMKITEINATME